MEQLVNIQESVAESGSAQLQLTELFQLSELQLLIVGGGIGDVQI
jgi:hypothetical protein